MPLLFGSSSSTSQQIDIIPSGLMVQGPSDPSGSCPTEINAIDFQNILPVKFGYDLSSGCVINVNRFVRHLQFPHFLTYENRSALKNLCCEGDSDVPQE